MSLNTHFSTLFDYKKVFVLYAKQIGWPVSTRFGYQITKGLPNILNNFSQWNNLPKLTNHRPAIDNLMNCQNAPDFCTVKHQNPNVRI